MEREEEIENNSDGGNSQERDLLRDSQLEINNSNSSSTIQRIFGGQLSGELESQDTLQDTYRCDRSFAGSNVEAEDRCNQTHTEHSTASGSNSEESIGEYDSPRNIEEKLDGFMVAAAEWNVIRIDGLVQLRKFAKIYDRKVGTFKGLETELEPCDRIYEMELINIDNAEMSILFCASSNRTVYNEQIRYNEMVQQVHKMIREVIIQSNTKTKEDILMRTDQHVVIYEKDWMTLSGAVAERLNNPSVVDQKSLPNIVKVRFLVKKLGHDRELVGLGPHSPERYPNINIQKAARITVHVAFDRVTPGFICWWTNKVIEKLGIQPLKTFNVGLIDGCNNYQFRIPTNTDNVKFVTCYLRLFHQIHRDENGYFGYPAIVKTLAGAYGGCLLNEKVKLNRKDNIIFNGELDAMVEGILECLRKGDSFPSRLECVWSSDRFYTHNDPSRKAERMYHVFCQALIDSIRFCKRLDLFAENLTYQMPAKLYTTVAVKWISTFFDSIVKVRNAVDIVMLHQNDMYQVPVDAVVHTKDFVLAYISEAFMGRLFRGVFGKFPNFLESYVQRKDPNTIKDSSWPFTGISVVNGKLSSTDININRLYRDFNVVLLGEYPNRFGEFITNFNAWKSFPVATEASLLSDAIKSMMKSLVEIVLDLLQRNCQDNEGAESQLRCLWSSITSRHAKRVKHSLDLYNIFAKPERGAFAALMPLAPLLQNVRAVMQHRLRGGFQTYLSIEIQRRMFEEKYPLKIKYNNFSVVYVVPCSCADGLEEDAARIHEYVFKDMFGVVIGKRSVPVLGYFTSLIRALNGEEIETRNRIDIQKIYDLLRGIIDDDLMIATDSFKRQLASIRGALQNPEKINPITAQSQSSAFRIPAKPRQPNTREHLDVIGAANDRIDFIPLSHISEETGEQESIQDELPMTLGVEHVEFETVISNSAGILHTDGHKRRIEERRSSTDSNDSSYETRRIPLAELIARRHLVKQTCIPQSRGTAGAASSQTAASKPNLGTRRISASTDSSDSAYELRRIPLCELWQQIQNQKVRGAQKNRARSLTSPEGSTSLNDSRSFAEVNAARGNGTSPEGSSSFSDSNCSSDVNLCKVGGVRINTAISLTPPEGSTSFSDSKSGSAVNSCKDNTTWTDPAESLTQLEGSNSISYSNYSGNLNSQKVLAARFNTAISLTPPETSTSDNDSNNSSEVNVNRINSANSLSPPEVSTSFSGPKRASTVISSKVNAARTNPAKSLTPPEGSNGSSASNCSSNVYSSKAEEIVKLGSLNSLNIIRGIHHSITEKEISSCLSQLRINQEAPRKFDTLSLNKATFEAMSSHALENAEAFNSDTSIDDSFFCPLKPVINQAEEICGPNMSDSVSDAVDASETDAEEDIRTRVKKFTKQKPTAQKWANSSASDLSHVNLTLRGARSIFGGKGNSVQAATGYAKNINRVVHLSAPGKIQKPRSIPPALSAVRTRRNSSESYKKYSSEETALIFEFIEKNELYSFVRGKLIYERMKELEVTRRTSMSMENHVKNALRSPAKLKEVLTEAGYQKLMKAIEDIDKTKHTNVISKTALNACKK